MGKLAFLSSPLSYKLLLILITLSIVAYGEETKSFYIVYLGDNIPVSSKESAVQNHIGLLSSVKVSADDAKESIVYSYTKSFNAFAAKLSKDEAEMLKGLDDVAFVLPNRHHKLHTTKSFDFIGLPLTAKRNLKFEKDIIVALLDTGTGGIIRPWLNHHDVPQTIFKSVLLPGITPESESFKDDGIGPVPSKWKGTCGPFANFSGCNNKIIGAKYYKLDGNPDSADISSPIDVSGHGTHVSSILAGNPVQDASLYGLAKGTARGAVPSARIAMYKVCWATYGCEDMDILAAIEDAISDGVDVISISIGGPSQNFVSGSISIGAFHALKKGIITVTSAGNGGPSLSTISNNAPWLLTVAASGIDRQFMSRVELGDGKSFSGIGINTFESKESLYPIVSGADVAMNNTSKEIARFCYDQTLDPVKVKGRLVYCKLGDDGIDSVVKGIGGVGLIVESKQSLDVAKIFMAPATIVNSTVGETIRNYIDSTRSPSAVVHKSEEVRIPAPFIASFSSRGPIPGSRHLLKPDIAAPGVDILAAYTLRKSLTGLKGDTQRSKFTLMSGTSVACPHVAGVAAYVKSFQPTWTPAAIKSAIMTTAKSMSRRVNKDAEFAYGAGQLNPRRAINPGLVYDMDEMSYVQFLCHEGYSGSSIAHLVGTKSINCSSMVPGFGYDALNYPSMQLSVKSGQQQTVGVFQRRVTNVGPPLVYNATIKAPKGVQIVVSPTSLVFTRSLEKQSFKVVVTAKAVSNFTVLSASLVWKSTHHTVRSPIVVYNLPE